MGENEAAVSPAVVPAGVDSAWFRASDANDAAELGSDPLFESVR